VLETDTPESLAARVFEQECLAYPEAIAALVEKRVQIHGGRAVVAPPVSGVGAAAAPG
jgi:phosphoribosylglycinamide formyltransferase-1